ncbi:MAG: segregation/condensation protein A [Firmicutes bacterium]|jgi:segregation and condensation protein A|nr:segregation/condensation protein A [Bacillota bacterium]
MSYHVQLDVFDGPLELLLHLLEQDKLDIRDIEISRITQQYLDYLATMREYDLEVAGDFLVMAATLLQIKVGALLPEAETELDAEAQDVIYSRDELIRRLLIYRQFREAGRQLEHLAGLRRQVYPRPISTLGPQGPLVYTNPIGEATVQDLALMYANTLLNWQAREEVRQVKRRAIDLSVRIGEVALLVQRHSRLMFDDLLSRQPTKTDIVYTFLAVLELVKQGIVQVRQAGVDQPITISFSKE